MGLRELQGIQNQDDLLSIQPQQLLRVLQEAAQEGEELQAENQSLKALTAALKEKLVWANGQLVLLTHRLFGRSSEKQAKDPKNIQLSGKNPNKSSPEKNQTPQEKSKTKLKDRLLKPSERYPNAPIIEQNITLEQAPNCPCCQRTMKTSGLTEDSECLHVIPKQFVIILQRRTKYSCGGCYGSIVTAPAPARIKPGSAYSDDLIVDVSLSKYCDLIPVERYAAMAGRSGVDDIPPHSLIQGTHYLADFLKPVYESIRKEVLQAKVLAADETPHRMLEGHAKKSWYLWGFSTPESSFFETHSTRSGDVASEVLKDSCCEVLLTDRYCGYDKSVRVANQLRLQAGLTLIVSAYCNAHARRRFKELEEVFAQDSAFFIKSYEKIYMLEAEIKRKPLAEIAVQRLLMRPIFESMRIKCHELYGQYSEKSQFYRAMNYFSESFEGLTVCLDDPRVPLDNNAQESRFRNPVVGRKTWMGTHSIRGAETAAIHFTLVESCKLNQINPRAYYGDLVEELLAGKPGFTPREWKNRAPPTG